jgi:ubiquinol-cytochrome c reductase cytochrome b subunit
MANGLLETIKARLGLNLLQYDIEKHANSIPYSLGGMSLVSL